MFIVTGSLMGFSPARFFVFSKFLFPFSTAFTMGDFSVGGGRPTVRWSCLTAARYVFTVVEATPFFSSQPTKLMVVSSLMGRLMLVFVSSLNWFNLLIPVL